MKNFFIYSVVFLYAFFASCSNANSGDNKNAIIEFSETEHDFGKIEQNSVAEYQFIFKNTGKEPLVISNVQTSCGCTVPEWTRDPIAKNKSGIVKVHYNTSIIGNFRKTIFVYSNANNSPITLVIKGSVLPNNEKKENE